MRTEIDSAIESHKAWVRVFKMSLEQIGAAGIDAVAAGDYRKCALGQWLSKNKASLDPVLVDQLNAQHIAFHLAAGSISRQINEKVPRAMIALSIDRIDRLSGLIVDILEGLKSKVFPAESGRA